MGKGTLIVKCNRTQMTSASSLYVFLSEKKTMPPRKMRAEDPLGAKEMKKEKKEEAEMAKKKGTVSPCCHSPLILLFS